MDGATAGSALSLCAVGLSAWQSNAADSATAATPATAGSFVGTATGTKLAVAGVAARRTATGRARKLSVYLCDGRTTRRWLTTTATGNTAALTAQGARVNVTLTAGAATGTITLPGPHPNR